AAPNIDMSNACAYDQGINEGIQNAFHDYFDGTIDEAKAKANFETAIKELYPELETVNWPE
ncbi:MAG: carbohydrate ABC transporter substrate-binding protein, partial [Firmicutes bacterium]|nr:carbohydrate ABC transporter substrate-binding protein [Bacillota bacterium]